MQLPYSHLQTALIAVTAKFYNEAFIVVEYFGYLGREPDILYLNWIQTLNRTNEYRLLGTGSVLGPESNLKGSSVMAKKRLGLLALSFCLLAASVSSEIARASVESKPVSIAEARALPLGTVVTVEGVVTVPPGAFKSSLLDEGFAIQDRSGGLYVRASTRTDLRLGRRVRVTGKLVDSNGLLAVEPSGASSVTPRGRGPGVRPKLIETGKVGETTEGLLLKVRGTVSRPVVDDPPYGFRLFLNDGTGEVQVYVSSSTEISPRGLEPGARLEVTGFGGQYKDHYEVNPRFPADIRQLP